MTLLSVDSRFAEAVASIEIAEKSGEIEAIIRAKLQFARLLFSARRKKRSIATLLEVEEIARANQSPLQVEILIGLGVLHKKCGLFSDAISWFEKSERLVDPGLEPHKFANIVNNKGNVYLRMGDLSSAGHYYALGMDALAGDQSDYLHAVMSMNMSLLESNRMNYHAADAWAQKALSFCETMDRHDIHLHILISAAVAKLQVGDVVAGEMYVSRALAKHEEKDNPQFDVLITALRLRVAAARNNIEFGRHLLHQLDTAQPELLDADTMPFVLKSKEIFYERIGDTSKLVSTLTTALNIALEESEGLSISSCAKKLSTLYTAEGNTEKVAEMLDHQAYAQYKLLAFSHQHAIRQLQIVQDVALTESAFDAEVQQETRLVTLQNELEQKKQELENLQSRVRDELAHVTHDLKNPLSNLLLLSKLVLSTPEENVEEWREFVQDAESSATAIRRLVATLPQVVESLRSNSADGVVDTFDMHELIVRVVSEYRILAREKGIVIEYGNDKSCRVNSVEHVVELVLRNTISNAVKYSRPNSRVQVTVECDDNSSTVRVIDAGRGFTTSDQQHLFKRMRRLSSEPTGGEDSSGVGLAVAKRLADQNNVVFELESTSTKGSIFKLQVPSADA